MARSRREKTLADYLVIAISPALIMALVGSLVFFLLEVVYRGDHAGRIQWVLVCYVFGAVLVARIGIEQGREQAQVYGVGLLAAACLFAFRFLDAFIVAWALLGVISWCSWKLTWDCTLIDDEEDASGQGLLQAAGLHDGMQGAAGEPSPAAAESTSGRRPADVRRESAADARDSLSDTRSASVSTGLLPDSLRAPVPKAFASASGQAQVAGERVENLDERLRKRKTAPHAPGVWVVYFSLAALPLFGVGQLLIPPSQSNRRWYAFQLLAGYVAAALGLLLTTSFLGLRRYLRQRNLQMPSAMTRGWLGMGVTLAVVVLAAAALIPRPQGEYTLTEMIDRLDKQVAPAHVAVLAGPQQPGGTAGGESGKDSDKPPGKAPVEDTGKEPANQPDKEPGKGAAPQKETDNSVQEPGHENPSSDEEPDEKESSQGPSNETDEDEAAKQSDEKSQPAKPEKTPLAGGKNEKGNQPPPNAGLNPPPQPQEKQQPAQPPTAPPQQPRQQQQQQQQQQQPNPQNPQAGQPAGAQNNAPPPVKSTLSQVGDTLSQFGGWLKWLFYLVLAALGMFYLVRNWSRIVAYMARLWRELLGLFGGGKGSEGDLAPAVDSPAKSRPFAAFENPFANGTARRMKLPQLLDYSFRALEAWARERRMPRSLDQTPMEFADDLAQRIPQISREATRTAQLYAQVAYANSTPSGDSLDVLERLWRRMDASRAGDDA